MASVANHGAQHNMLSQLHLFAERNANEATGYHVGSLLRTGNTLQGGHGFPSLQGSAQKWHFLSLALRSASFLGGSKAGCEARSALPVKI